MQSLQAGVKAVNINSTNERIPEHKVVRIKIDKFYRFKQKPQLEYNET